MSTFCIGCTDPPSKLDRQGPADPGHLAVLAHRAALPEPPWAAELVPCPAACSSRTELVDLVEELRAELAAALTAAPHQPVPPTPT